MNTNHLPLCAWSGPLFCLFMVAGYVVTGFLPTLDPTLEAGAIAGIYQDNIVAIRSGLVLMIIGGFFFAPFMASIIVQMTRMANPSPVLIICFSLVCAAVTIALFAILVGWGTAAYRPEGSAEITRAFHDYAFLFLLWPGTLMPVSYIAIGLAVLADDQAKPLFPRWFAFYSFWSALLALTGCFIIFFKTGPFAIDGLFAFWVNLGVFFLWYLVTSVVLLKSVQQAQRAGLEQAVA